jgi:hypothetical protein
MTTIKPIIKSALSSPSKSGDLKRKLEEIDPIEEIEEPRSMIFQCELNIFVMILCCILCIWRHMICRQSCLRLYQFVLYRKIGISNSVMYSFDWNFSDVY